MRGRRPGNLSNNASEVGFWQELKALSGLFPFLWPRHSLALRLRVIVAIALLVAAKGVNVTVPMIYKRSVDALTPGHAAFVVVPVMLVVAYGLARVFSQLSNELRDAVFAKVEQNAVRRVALATFRHLHALSLRFHLDRQTGGLSRAIERGIRGTEFLLSYFLFNFVPTMVEILLVCGILWRLYSVTFAAATIVTVVA